MAKRKPAGLTGGRLVEIPIEQLFLDQANPRLSEENQGKSESEILTYMFKNFDLDELAVSLSENGYFDEEPIVVVPKKLPARFERQSSSALKKDGSYLEFITDSSTDFIVAEGNRRVATIKILLNPKLRQELRIKSWPSISTEVSEDLMRIPSIVYKNRTDVLPYLGVRHITGIKRWEPYAKARYIADLVARHKSLEEIEEQIGDRSGSIRKSFLSYCLLKQAEERGIDADNAKENFSYLLLAVNQLPVREFLGLKGFQDFTHVNPISKKYVGKLDQLFTWLFGNGGRGPIIEESRDITDKLTPVLKSREALRQLTTGSDLETAFEYTDGEETMLLKYLTKANKYIENGLGIIHRHKTEDIEEQVKRLSDNIKELRKILE